MTERGPETVGVLADPYLDEWQLRAIDRATTETGITVPLVVVNDPPDGEDPDAVANAVNDGPGIASLGLLGRTILRERAWALVLAERELATLVGEEYPLRKRRAVTDARPLEDADVRVVEPTTDGAWAELPVGVVDELADRCDVVLRFGFGLIRGGVLDAPTFGVLSFHPADIRRYRGLGTPTAYADGRDEIGVTLQRLSTAIDGGEIVAESRVDVTACATLWDVYERVYDRQIELVSEGLERLRDPAFEPTVPDSLGPYYPRDVRRSPRFAARTLARTLRGRCSRQR